MPALARHVGLAPNTDVNYERRLRCKLIIHSR